MLGELVQRIINISQNQLPNWFQSYFGQATIQPNIHYYTELLWSVWTFLCQCRIFSVAGAIARAQRNTLAPTTVESLLLNMENCITVITVYSFSDSAIQSQQIYSTLSRTCLAMYLINIYCSIKDFLKCFIQLQLFGQKDWALNGIWTLEIWIWFGLWWLGFGPNDEIGICPSLQMSATVSPTNTVHRCKSSQAFKQKQM